MPTYCSWDANKTFSAGNQRNDCMIVDNDYQHLHQLCKALGIECIVIETIDEALREVIKGQV